MIKFLLCLFILPCHYAFSQHFLDLNDNKLRVQFSGGIGKSFIGGTSYGAGGEFLYRMNQIGFRYNYDGESYTYLHTPGTWNYGDGGYIRNCQEYMFYYGRSLQVERFIATARLGVCKMTYKDASYTSEHFYGNWFLDEQEIYTVQYDYKRGYGILAEVDANILFLPFMGCGVRIYSNFNKIRNMGGIQFYLNFLIGPK